MISDKVLVAGVIVLVLLVVLVILGRVITKRGRNRELREYASNKKREEMLDQVILNVYDKKEGAKSESVPYDVDYSESSEKQKPDRGKAVNAGGLMLQLTEHSELSVRKHVLNPEQVIRIGSKLNENDILVSDADDVQCEIFLYDGQVWIREVGSQRKTILKRRKNRAYVTQNGVKLLSGDCIFVGNIYFEVALIK